MLSTGEYNARHWTNLHNARHCAEITYTTLRIHYNCYFSMVAFYVISKCNIAGCRIYKFKQKVKHETTLEMRKRKSRNIRFCWAGSLHSTYQVRSCSVYTDLGINFIIIYQRRSIAAPRSFEVHLPFHRSFICSLLHHHTRHRHGASTCK